MRLMILMGGLALVMAAGAQFGGREDAPRRAGLTQAPSPAPAAPPPAAAPKVAAAAGTTAGTGAATGAAVPAIATAAPVAPLPTLAEPVAERPVPALARTEPQVQPAPAVSAAPAASAPAGSGPAPATRPEPVALRAPEVMFVSASAVNVRGGPSTGHEVIGRLSRDEAVEVVERDPSGWMLVRIEGDGVEGWVSGRLLRD